MPKRCDYYGNTSLCVDRRAWLRLLEKGEREMSGGWARDEEGTGFPGAICRNDTTVTKQPLRSNTVPFSDHTIPCHANPFKFAFNTFFYN